MRATWPQSVLAICADESSASDRKMGVRSVWSSSRHASDCPSTARSDEIDCVVTIGINGPGTVFIERTDRMTAVDEPELTPEAAARAAVQIARPLGKDPLSAGRRLAGRHLRPAGRADGGDHHPPLRRPCLHYQGADRKRIAPCGGGRGGRGGARAGAQRADLGRYRIGEDDATERARVAAAG